MKKLLLVCAFVMGISAVSFAQGGRQRQTPEQQLTTLKTQVTGITDDQSAKITTIFVAAAKSRDSLFQAAQDGGDRATMMQSFMKMQSGTGIKVKSVLTASQQAEYQKVLDAQAERMKQMMQGGGN